MGDSGLSRAAIPARLRWLPDRRSLRPGTPRAVALLASAALLAVTAIDMVGPRAGSTGALLVPVVAAGAIFLRRAPSVVLLLCAAASRLLLAASGRVPDLSAAVDAVAMLGAAAGGWLLLPTRAGGHSGAPEPTPPAAVAVAQPEAAEPAGVARLSRRQREVLILALVGLSAREIGVRLFITERTVETHLANAYRRLGIHSRGELAGVFPAGEEENAGRSPDAGAPQGAAARPGAK